MNGRKNQMASETFSFHHYINIYFNSIDILNKDFLIFLMSRPTKLANFAFLWNLNSLSGNFSCLMPIELKTFIVLFELIRICGISQKICFSQMTKYENYPELIIKCIAMQILEKLYYFSYNVGCSFYQFLLNEQENPHERF